MQPHHQQSSDLSFSPSFNSYSSDNLAVIAEKVCHEESQGDPLEDNEFEFVSFVKDSDDQQLDANQIRPIFPIFNRDLLLDDDFEDDLSSVRLPLKNLFIRDGDRDADADGDPPSSSSSEADELDGASPATYCVWAPKSTVPSPERCKKSKSTGSSSRRWRLRDLVRRCNSTGKESFVFLTPSSSQSSSTKRPEINVEKAKNSKEGSGSGDIKAPVGKGKAKGVFTGAKKVTSAHEAFYVRNRALKEGDKRRSYLPYKQDLFGFFSNNGLGRTFPPF